MHQAQQKQAKHWKVGELAERTGLSVRTLHHYDEIGLLIPSHRTPSGHRLYAEADVARLQQIVSLRSLGLPLDEVRDCLDRRGLKPLEVIRLHAARLREQMETQARLVERLEAVATGLQSAEGVSADDIIRTIREIQMFEKYYTPEQLAELKERAERIGPQRMKEVEAEWPALMAEVRAEMEKGTDPAAPRMQELARRWRGLIEEFTGGNPGIEQSLRNLYQGEPQMRERAGFDPALSAYVQRALDAARAE